LKSNNIGSEIKEKKSEVLKKKIIKEKHSILFARKTIVQVFKIKRH
jgi:hypothetical protein